MTKTRLANPRSPVAFAGLRASIGLLFLILAEYKVFGTEFTFGGGMAGWIHQFIHDGAYPLLVPVLANFVLPHALVLSFLVAYGELAIGLSLTLGVLVRPASVFGFLYMVALLFSSNYPGPHLALWRYFGASLDHSVLALCFAAFAFGKPDKLLSIRRWTLSS